MLLLLLLRAVAVAVLVARVRATCYFLNGTIPPGDSYQPCDSTGEFSPCCATNKTNPDVCLSSGLCYAQNPGYEGLIYANGCTDKTGSSMACPQICPQRVDVAVWNVLQCNNNQEFCCRPGGDMTNCCQNSSAVTSVSIGLLQLPTQTTTVGAGATATVTATATTTTTINATSTGQCRSDKSDTVAVGVVGGVLGAALLASVATIAVLLMQQRRLKHEKKLIESRPAPVIADPYAFQNPEGKHNYMPVQELAAAHGVHEIEGKDASQPRPPFMKG